MLSRIRQATATAALLGFTAIGPGCGAEEVDFEELAPSDGGGSVEVGGAGEGSGAPAPAPPTQAQATQVEANFLKFSREEEKMARDVFLSLAGTYPAAAEVAASQQRHMDAVLVLLQRYGIPDPAEGQPIGEFTSDTFQALFDELVPRGMSSSLDATTVGLTVEELIIRDLSANAALMIQPDIRATLDDLLRAARNQLRGFYQTLLAQGGTYLPQYLDLVAFQDIVATPIEVGSPTGL